MNSKQINWKKTFSLWAILVMLIGGFFSPLVMAQQKPEDELAELFGPLINFEYAAPIETIKKHFGAGMIEDTLHDGIVTVRLDDHYYPLLKKIAPKELSRIYYRYNLDENRHKAKLSILRTTKQSLDDLLKITGSRVALTIVLIDDSKGLPKDEYSFLTTRADWDDGKRYVWPSTGNSSDDDGTGYYSSWIYLGAKWAKEFGESKHSLALGYGGPERHMYALEDATIVGLAAKSIFIYDPSNFVALNEVATGYERKDGSFVEELWPSKKNASLEGIAKYYRMASEFGSDMNDAEYALSAQISQFFRDPGYRYMIQETSILAGLKKLKQAEHRERDLIGVKGMEYRWKDVPGYYLLFSENTTYGLLHAFYMQAYSTPDFSYEVINKAMPKLWETKNHRDPMVLVNELAIQMEINAANGVEKRALENGNGTVCSSMYPFYLIDMLTHFGMSESQFKNTYNEHNKGPKPIAFNEYWKHRDALKAMVTPLITEDEIGWMKCSN